MSRYSTFTGVPAKDAKEEVEAYAAAAALNRVGERGNFLSLIRPSPHLVGFNVCLAIARSRKNITR